MNHNKNVTMFVPVSDITTELSMYTQKFHSCNWVCVCVFLGLWIKVKINCINCFQAYKFAWLQIGKSKQSTHCVQLWPLHRKGTYKSSPNKSVTYQSRIITQARLKPSSIDHSFISAMFTQILSQSSPRFGLRTAKRIIIFKGKIFMLNSTFTNPIVLKRNSSMLLDDTILWMKHLTCTGFPTLSSHHFRGMFSQK